MRMSRFMTAMFPRLSTSRMSCAFTMLLWCFTPHLVRERVMSEW